MLKKLISKDKILKRCYYINFEGIIINFEGIIINFEGIIINFEGIIIDKNNFCYISHFIS